MELVVGDEKCGYLEICRILLASKSCEPLLDKLVPLARSLQLPVDVIRKLKLNEKLSLESSHESLHQILENWRSSQSLNAKLSVLIAELERLELANCAEDLRNYFKIQQTRSAFYTCPPTGYHEFIASKFRVLVISSMDKSVTASKLTDTTNCVHLQDNLEFARRLAAGKAEECFSIACDDNFNLLDAHRLLVPVPRSKVIVITEDTIEKASSICSELEHITVVRDTLKWSHLSPLGQVSFAQNSIFISGKHMPFKQVANKGSIGRILDDVLDEKLLLNLVNDKRPSLLESGTPAPIKYYVSRRISPRNLLNTEKIFKSRNDIEDIFLFTGLERHELSRLAYPNSTDTSSNQRRLPHPNVKHILLEMKSDFANIAKKTGAPLHWIDFKEGKFYWLKTWGNVDPIQEAVADEREQREYSEGEFVQEKSENNNDLPVIIADRPGMGKSELLANFARKLESQGEIVLFGNMYNVVKGTKKIMQESRASVGLDDALIQQLSILGRGSGQLAQAFLIDALKSRETDIRINIMMDGLDEVLAPDMELAFQILKGIKLKTSTRLWVATRPQFLKELENCLSSLGHTIREFDSRDQVECLVKFWTESNTCAKRLDKFANHCLKELALCMKSEIAGVPLQCMLIGEIFKEEANNFADPDNLTTELLPTIQIESITQLFQVMIEKKFENFFERYKRVSNKAATNFYKKGLIQAHIFFSLKLLFPEFNILKESSRLQMKDVQNVGILKFLSSDGVPQFIHRLFAEFFVALFLKRIFSREIRQGEIVDMDRFFSAVFTTSEYIERIKFTKIKTYKFEQKMILYFVDQLIQPSSFNFCLSVNSRQLAHACTNDNFPNLFECFDKMNLFAGPHTPVLDSNLISLAAKNSEIELIAKICEKYEKWSGFRVRDIILPNSWTLLHIAVANRAYSVVEHFINRQGFHEILQTSRSLICYLVCECALGSNFNSDQLIREKCDTLNLLLHFNNECLGDPGDKNPLWLMSVHLNLICQLIRLGVDVMVLDHNQMSILHLYGTTLNAEHYHELVTHIPTTSLSKLLQVKEARDGFTPLHSLVLHKDPDPRTLQLFKELGADFNSSNLNNDSLLETAVKQHRSIATLDQLIRHGADWWPKKELNEDWSILHVALGSLNMEAFKYFCEKMTDDPTRVRNIVHWDDLEKLQVISEVGMNLNAKDKLGETLLQRILKNGSEANDPIQLISLLERHGAVSSAHLAFEAVAYVIKQKNVSKERDLLVRRILSKWPSALEERDKEGNTLLHHAASTSTSNQNLFDNLISRKVDTNSKNNLGETPLHLVLEIKCAKILVKHGADLNSLDDNKMTPLHRAIQRKNTPVVKSLLKFRKADDNSHLPILDYLLFASKFGDFPTFQACLDYLERGENSNVVERDNLSMLRASVRNEDPRIFEHLLEKVDDKDLDQIVHEIVTSIEPTEGNMSIIDGKIKMLEFVKTKNIALLNSADSSSRIPLLLDAVQVDLRIWLMNNVVEPMVVDMEGRNVVFYGSTQQQRPQQLHKFIEHLIESGNGQQFITEGSTLLLEISRRKNVQVTIETLEHFKDHGVDFNSVDDDGMSLLMHAVKSGWETSLLTKLVELGSDFTMTNKQQSGILHLATEYCNIPAVKIFVTKCDVNCRNIDSDTPLHIAIKSLEKKHVEIAFILISEGADINAENKDGISALNAGSYLGLLHHAAIILDSDAIKFLIKKRFDVNARNKYGGMPIHYAVRGKLHEEVIMRIMLENMCEAIASYNPFTTPSHNIDIGRLYENWMPCLKLLVEQGATLYAKDENGRNILHLALLQHSDEDFRKLLDYVVANSEEQLIRKKDKSKCTVLHLAVLSTRIGTNTLANLLQYNDISDTDLNGNNVLHYWIHGRSLSEFGGNVDILKFLLEEGADVNAKNDLGHTILHKLVMAFKPKNWQEALVLLMHHGANMFDKNSGKNLAHVGAASGNHEDFERFVSLIIARGLEKLLREKDGNGGSVLHSAACYLELNEGLLTKLVCFNDINDVDNDGDSVLYWAIQGQRAAGILELLTINGAEWKEATNKGGDTVLHFASWWGSVEALRFFIGKGCYVNAVNKLGETPLHCALRGERLWHCDRERFTQSVHDVVEVLMNASPDLNTKNHLGQSPTVLAKEQLQLDKLAQGTVDLLSGDGLVDQVPLGT